MEALKKLKELPKISKPKNEHQSLMCDNLVLRLKIKRKEKEILEIRKNIQMGKEENEKLINEEVLNENNMNEGDVQENFHSEFYETLAKNIEFMESKLKAQNSPFFYLKSVCSNGL